MGPAVLFLGQRVSLDSASLERSSAAILLGYADDGLCNGTEPS